MKLVPMLRLPLPSTRVTSPTLLRVLTMRLMSKRRSVNSMNVVKMRLAALLVELDQNFPKVKMMPGCFPALWPHHLQLRPLQGEERQSRPVRLKSRGEEHRRHC